MLCTRPVKCCGLSIFLLHPVFARYLSIRKEAPLATHEARTALHVSGALCSTMGTTSTGRDRRDAFLQVINPRFSQWITTKEVTSRGATTFTRTDTTISVNGIVMLLIEAKNERVRNTYMQASRAHEFIAEALTEKNSRFLTHGAPVFISYLNSQLLL